MNISSGGTKASNNGTTGNTSASLAVTSAANHLVFGNVSLAKNSAGNPVTVTSGNTNLTDISDNASGSSTTHVHGNASSSVAVSPTMSWTFSATTPWAIVTAVLTPVPKHKAEVILGA